MVKRKEAENFKGVAEANESIEHLSTHSNHLKGVGERLVDQIDKLKEELQRQMLTAETVNQLTNLWGEAGEVLTIVYEDIHKILEAEEMVMDEVDKYIKRSIRKVDRLEKKAIKEIEDGQNARN